MNLNELANGKAMVTIAGCEVEVNTSDPVKETVKRILQEKGIDSFTILVDGKEVTSTNDLPETFGELNRDPEQLGVGILEPEGFFLGLGRDLQDAGGTDPFDRILSGGGGHGETLDESQIGCLDRCIERGS